MEEQRTTGFNQPLYWVWPRAAWLRNCAHKH